MLLMLIMKDGYAEMLEGAAVDDSTPGIGLSTLRFKIAPAYRPIFNNLLVLRRRRLVHHIPQLAGRQAID